MPWKHGRELRSSVFVSSLYASQICLVEISVIVIRMVAKVLNTRVASSGVTVPYFPKDSSTGSQVCTSMNSPSRMTGIPGSPSVTFDRMSSPSTQKGPIVDSGVRRHDGLSDDDSAACERKERRDLATAPGLETPRYDFKMAVRRAAARASMPLRLIRSGHRASFCLAS